MKRLLCITANMNAGGAETFLMKVYRVLDKTKYQMDFCVSSEKNDYTKEINKMGGIIYVIPSKSENAYKSFNAIRKIVSENRYEYVMRVNEHSLSVIDLIAAKFGGATKLIMRSSNSSSGGKVATLLHKTFKFLPISVPDIKLAPSLLAAEYTFGKKNVKTNKVTILRNGLDIDSFCFDMSKRNKIRKEFNLNNKFVVGHIGRFNKQKNHKLLLCIFCEIKTIKPNSMLLMVGVGNMMNEIKEEAIKLGIGDSCIFCGKRTDVDALLSAMDVFVFPSLYEGMPNTVIEAQVSGLPCLISDKITKEANITGIVHFMSLDIAPKYWAEKAVNLDVYNREKYANIVRESGYSIQDVVKEFESLVFEK